MKLVCFDIDGTLISTDGAGRRAIHRAMVDEIGTAGPIDSYRFDGRTDGEIVRDLATAAGLAVDDVLVDLVLRRYLVNLEAELGRSGYATQVHPGVREILDVLEARSDIVLALLTGNIAGGAALKLRSAGLHPERFVIGAYGSDHHVRSELPAVAKRRVLEVLGHDLPGRDIVIIGDTPADMQCGRAIGARGIGVATARFSVAELMAAGGYAAFSDLSDTNLVLRTILE